MLIIQLHLVTRLSKYPGQGFPFLPFALRWKPGHSDDTPTTNNATLCPHLPFSTPQTVNV